MEVCSTGLATGFSQRISPSFFCAQTNPGSALCLDLWFFSGIRFRGSQDFRIERKQRTVKLQTNNKNDNSELTETFKKMLIEISKSYKQFPDYIIELKAENYNIQFPMIKVAISTWTLIIRYWILVICVLFLRFDQSWTSKF